MNKKFLSAILFGALMVTSTGTFVSCKDYDDDIEDLNKKYEQIASDLSTLKTQVGQYVKAVSYDPSTGILTVTSGEASATYTIPLPKNAPEYTLSVEKGADGNYTISLKKDETAVSTGTITMPTESADFDSSLLKWKDGFLYYGDTKISGVEKPAGNISASIQKTEVDGVVVSYTINIGDESATFDIKDATPLKSLVFIPQSYLSGVEAMKAASINYTEWTLKTQDTPATEFGEVWNAPATNSYTISPKLVAEYHLNPSTVSRDQIKKLEFVYDDKDFVGRSANFNPTVESYEVNEGTLKVVLNVNSADIQKIDANKISVLAVKATVEVNGVEKIVTSDYAAIYKTTFKNLVLALNNKKTAVNEHNRHLYGADNEVGKDAVSNPQGKAETAIKNDADLTVKFDDTEGIDLSKYVETHHDEYADDGENNEIAKDEVLENIENYNLQYRYRLSNYYIGSNKTEQNDFATLTGSVLKAKLFSEDTQYAAVGRMPIVCVELFDTQNQKVVNTGYIKILITKDKGEGGKWDKDFGTSDQICDNLSYSTTVEEMNTKIYNALKMSKKEFYEAYNLKGVNRPADAANGTYSATVENGIGKVDEIWNADPADGATAILKWTIGSDEVTKALATAKAAGKYEAELTATVVYESVDGVREPFTVTFKTKVYAPTATILAGKIKEYWYDDMSTIHLNTVVYGTLTNDCAFANDLDNVFVGNKPAFSVNHATADFTGENQSYWYEFSSKNNLRVVKDVDGNDYTLFVPSAKPGTLRAIAGEVTTIPADNEGELVAEIKDTYNEADNVVVYNDDSDIAKAILNVSAHNEAPFFTWINVQLEGKCDPITVTDGEFKAEFLRPVNVLKVDGAHFEDGVDNGSTVKMLDLVKLTDWRDYSFAEKFKDGNNYYSYYEVESITIDKANIKTDLNGSDINTTKLSSITDQIYVDDTKLKEYGSDPSKATEDYGTLTYYNNTNTVQNFKLNIPVVVTYKWGKVKVNVIIPVQKTAGN